MDLILYERLKKNTDCKTLDETPFSLPDLLESTDSTHLLKKTCTRNDRESRALKKGAKTLIGSSETTSSLKSTSRLDTGDKSRQRIHSANGKCCPEQHSHADYGVSNIFTVSRHIFQNDLGTFVGFQDLIAELVPFLEESGVELWILIVRFQQATRRLPSKLVGTPHRGLLCGAECQTLSTSAVK